MADRRHRLDRDVHGGLGHHDRQRGPAAHRGFAGSEPRPEHLRHDELPGQQRDRPADQRLACERDRPQAFLYGLRGAVHGQLVDVRFLDLVDHAPGFPRDSGLRRRRLGAGGAEHVRRHLSGVQARDGVRDLRPDGGDSTRHRPDDRRLGHRQLLVALGLLHESADGPAVARADRLLCERQPADGEGPRGASGQGPEGRLCGLRTDRARLRGP